MALNTNAANLTNLQQLAAAQAAFSAQISASQDPLKKLMDGLGEVKRTVAGLSSLNPFKNMSAKPLLDGVREAQAAFTAYIAVGLRGTVQGEILAYQFTRLAREITSLFLPAIQAVGKVMDTITQKMRELSGSQQESVKWWLISGAALFGIISPLAAVTMKLGEMMMSNEQGREALSEIAKTFMDVFTEIGTLLADTLLPVLQSIADFLSSSVGKWVLFGVVATVAIRSITVALYGMLGPLGLIIAALSILGGANMGKPVQGMKDLNEQVRTRTLTAEQAKKIAEERINEDTAQKEEKIKSGSGRSGWGLFRRITNLGMQNENNLDDNDPADTGNLTKTEALARNERRRKEKIDVANKEIDVASKNRSNVTPTSGGPEDVRKQIERVQTAALKVDDPMRKTAENTDSIAKTLRQLYEKWLADNKQNNETGKKQNGD